MVHESASSAKTSDSASVGESSGDPSSSSEPQSAAEAFSSARDRFHELKEYLAYSVSIKIDRLRSAVRSALLWTIVGVIAAMAGVGLIVTAVVLLCVGVANALGLLLHSQWMGDCLTGVLILAILALSILIIINRITKASFAGTVKKYEARRASQKARFGHDIGDQSRGTDGKD